MCEIYHGAVWEIDEPMKRGYILGDDGQMHAFSLVGYRSLRITKKDGLRFVDKPPMNTPKYKLWVHMNLKTGDRVVYQKARIPGLNHHMPDSYNAFPWVLESVYSTHVRHAAKRGIANQLQPVPV